ncbi:MAG: hypothetical protein WBY24_07210, partial [Candidatus Acidiferrales bacterium]
MNRLSPRRLFVFLRHITPLDRVALVVIALYVAVRVIAAFGEPVPLSGFIGFLGFLAAIYILVRLVPWFRTKFMWTLRNRLIVAYVFIAVVPVILLL